MTTARARHRPRPLPPASSATAEDEAPDTARMRKALELTAAGSTQAQIAHALGCSDRTVRTVIRKARARQVATFKARSPEAVVADFDHRSATQLARWNSLWARARAAGDLRAEAVVMARIDAALTGRMTTLARIGFFDGTTFVTGAEGDEREKQAKHDRKALTDILMLSAAVNRGDDVDSIVIGSENAEDDFDPDDPLYG